MSTFSTIFRRSKVTFTLKSSAFGSRVRRLLHAGAPETAAPSPALILPVNHSSGDVSYFSHIGGRGYMEDTSIVSGAADFVAVFDGHCGHEVSKFLQNNFYYKYRKEMRAVINEKKNCNSSDNSSDSSKNIELALKRTVDSLDEEVLKNNETYQNAGSTASILVLLKNKIGGDTAYKQYITCNVGDSRVVLSRNGKAVDLTEDHCPGRIDEQERIKSVGGYVKWDGHNNRDGTPMIGSGVYRVYGVLSLSRAIGDLRLRPAITSTPDIVTHTPSPELDDFIIVSTDGLWHDFSSQEAVDFVNSKLSEAKAKGSDILLRAVRENMSKLLINAALNKGGDDNLTVIVRWLK